MPPMLTCTGKSPSPIELGTWERHLIKTHGDGVSAAPITVTGELFSVTGGKKQYHKSEWPGPRRRRARRD